MLSIKVGVRRVYKSSLVRGSRQTCEGANRVEGQRFRGVRVTCQDLVRSRNVCLGSLACLLAERISGGRFRGRIGVGYDGESVSLMLDWLWILDGLLATHRLRKVRRLGVLESLTTEHAPFVYQQPTTKNQKGARILHGKGVKPPPSPKSTN